MNAAFATSLEKHGLNRLHVFNLAELPEALRRPLPLAPDSVFRQLILLGHGGRRLWQAMNESRPRSAHPIDDFTVDRLQAAFTAALPDARYRILYPGDAPLDLRGFGRLAGWHHDSPLMIGVDTEWGSWFAYRAAVLADTDLAQSPAAASESPCAACRSRDCIAACPGEALRSGQLDVDACISWRLRPDSPCRHDCPARQACPSGREHRYDAAQMRHCYGHSLATIEAWSAGKN